MIPKELRSSKEINDKRNKLCLSCEHRVKSTGSCGTLGIGKDVIHNWTWVHLCGCVTRIKAMFKNYKCDLGKW